jgi:hypothetical protein
VEANRDGAQGWDVVVLLIPDPIQEVDWPRNSVTTGRWVNATSEWWEQVSPTRQELRKEDDSHWDIYEQPSHWMPLPDTPA